MMKMRHWITRIMMTIVLTAECGDMLGHPVAVKGDVTYSREDSLTIVDMLQDARRQPSSTNMPVFFAMKFLGRPYVAHTLEVNDKEQLVINTRQLDCTTLIENVVALTQCAYNKRYSWDDYLHYIYKIRYKDGKNKGYASRLHYFTQWIDDNTKKGIVREIQQPVPPFSGLQTINLSYMSNNAMKYKALKSNPKLVKQIRIEENRFTGRKYRYIPKSMVKTTACMKKAVNNGDIIAITCNKKGLDIAHLGIAVWKNDGLHLLNASQIHKKVVLEPMLLGTYLKKHPSHTGIRVVRENMDR